MEQKYKSLKTALEKKKFIDLNRKISDAQEVTNIYKAIMDDKSQDNFDCLQHALKENLGGLFPYDRGNTFKRQLVDPLLKFTTDFAQMGLFCRFIKCYFQTFDHLSTPEYKQIMKFISELLEKIMTQKRQEGVLEKSTYILRSDDIDKNPMIKVSQLEKQSTVVDMLIELTPEYFLLNPEMFQIIHNVFTSGATPDDYNGKQLDLLAKAIKGQCTSDLNMNNEHDWMIVLSAFFEQVYRGEGIGMIFLLENIEIEILTQLIITNQKYLLLNYFNKPEVALKIFGGLSNHYLKKSSIEIISQISKLILKQAQGDKMTNKPGSRLHYQILETIYKQFILTKIASNIQMFQILAENIELIEFYMIGLCQIIRELPEGTIQLFCRGLNILLNLKFNTRDFTPTIYNFVETIKFYYPKYAKDQNLINIQALCKQKCFGELKPQNPSSKQHLVWQLDFQNKQMQDLNFELLQKDGDQYVGLENLGNTCFINSFIQCLFMNQKFREIILQLKFELDPGVFFEEQQSLITSLQITFMRLTFQKQGYCSPYILKRQLRSPYGDTYDQQDVGEFGAHFLEDIHDLIKSNSQFKKLQNQVSSLFVGTHYSVLKCRLCRYESKTADENFMNLQLHFRHNSNQSIYLNKDLKNMIREYFEPESIEFTCQSCKKMADNTKQNRLKTLPPYLMVTLMRFTYDVQFQTKIKMLDKVNMVFEFDVRDIFPEKNLPERDEYKYELYAFIVHMGSKSDSGHYITYARQLDKDKDKWINFDDSFITSFVVTDPSYYDEQLIDQETPYMLFYRNKSQQPVDLSKLLL